MENSQKNIQKYRCDSCDYNTGKLQDYNKHLLTLKHIFNTKNETLAINGNKKVSNKYSHLNCSHCNYNTNIKSSYDKHLLSEKHKRNVSGESKEVKHKCNECNKEYLNYNALWKHKKHCFVTTERDNETLQNTFIPSNVINPELFMEVLKESKELQNVLIELVLDKKNVVLK